MKRIQTHIQVLDYTISGCWKSCDRPVPFPAFPVTKREKPWERGWHSVTKFVCNKLPVENCESLILRNSIKRHIITRDLYMHGKLTILNIFSFKWRLKNNGDFTLERKKNVDVKNANFVIHLRITRNFWIINFVLQRRSLSPGDELNFLKIITHWLKH
jgi:hypothetical protein